MDECLVARNAVTIIKRTLARARKVHQPALDPQPVALNMEAIHVDGPQVLHEQEQQHQSDNTGSGPELDWFSSFPLDPQQAMFWTEWTHEVDLLGT